MQARTAGILERVGNTWNQARIARLGLIALAAVMASAAGCGPDTIQGINFCGRIFYAPGEPVRAGVAIYRVIWTVNGKQYDSDHYGAPTAEIDVHGWACFEGGVGPTTELQEFELKSLTVRVVDGAGKSWEGSGTELRWKYDDPTQELDVYANFDVAPAAGSIALPPLLSTGAVLWPIRR
jgi:hypothetical protein